MHQISVLFVCTANICRSPTAEGIFARLVRDRGYEDRIAVDSAGIIGGRAGEAPDPRAQRTALNYGVDLSNLRARQVSQEDFAQFHYIIAMDCDNVRRLQIVQPEEHTARIQLFCEFIPHRKEREVADPYVGGHEAFEHVFELCSEAAEGLFAALVAEHFPS
jgi:protein-tyrosine phosphatase